MPRVHVVPRYDGWAVKTEGATRAYKTFNTKDEALREALSYGRRTKNDVVVHGRDNRIQKIITPRDIEEGGNCFLTTACVEYYNLRDNCYQLRTLRNFRDNYLAETKRGQNIILQYNKIAPVIVSLLKRDVNKNVLFEFVINEINIACNAIEMRNYKKAILIYKKAVLKLARHYHLV